MCGICGFAGFNDPPLLEAMTERLRHRGPDDDGFHRTPDVGLGCRRLSIIDLAGGHMPIYNEDRSIVVIQNGEIFNYKELQETLRKRGHTLASQSDTEVLVHLYEEYGADFCKELNGDFAIAVWDEPQKRLLLCRDRMGVHPLYYAQSGSEIAFASELKSLLCWSKIDRTLDPAAIDAYLALRYVPGQNTFFKNIHRLSPGCTLSFQKGRISIQPYWQLPEAATSPTHTFQEAADILTDLLQNSVELRLRADVPVGAYLSGGLDSSLILALMRRVNRGAIKTFSIGFGLPTDELSDARRTAAHYGTDHQEIMIGARDYELLPKILWHLDEPIGDSIIIPNYRLSQAAAKQVKVVTSGEGADEAWGGYVHHLTFATMQRLDRYFPRGWSSLLGQLVRHVPTALMDAVFPYPAALGRQGQSIFSQFLLDYSKQRSSRAYLTLASLYRPEEKLSAYAPGFIDQLSSVPSLEEALSTAFDEHRSILANVIALDLKNWLPNYTLFRQDKIGFANSLEIRVPYLDHRIVEFAMRQPDTFKVQGLTVKRLLRQSGGSMLPPTQARKRKQAFYFPVRQVFGKDYDSFVTDILGSSRARARGIFSDSFLRDALASLSSTDMLAQKRLFALVTLELWFRIFVDGEEIR